ncbi:hypothetical protein PLANTIT3_20059 [Plantibacter sp. T3]|nr:hypothetical protein PLANTIT3_20059 [Plantibacter sp. T3]
MGDISPNLGHATNFEEGGIPWSGIGGDRRSLASGACSADSSMMRTARGHSTDLVVIGRVVVPRYRRAAARPFVGRRRIHVGIVGDVNEWKWIRLRGRSSQATAVLVQGVVRDLRRALRMRVQESAGAHSLGNNACRDIYLKPARRNAGATSDFGADAKLYVFGRATPVARAQVTDRERLRQSQTNVA